MELRKDAIREWLGPRSNHAWDGLIEMWEDIAKKASGELPRGPFDTQLPDIKDSKLKKIFFRTIQRPPS